MAGNDDYWVQGGNGFAAHPGVVPPKPAEMKDTASPLAWSRKSPAAAEFSLKNRPFLFSDKPSGMVTGAGYENLYSEPIFTEDTTYASVFSQKEKYAVTRGHTFVRFKPFDKIVARDLTKPRWRMQGKGISGASKHVASIAAIEFPVKWEMETSLRVLIKAGRHLIAGGLQCLRHGEDIQCHPFTLQDGMSDPMLKGRAPVHHGGTCRRTGRADSKIGEAGRMLIEAVNMRGLEDPVAHTGQIAHALIIGHHQNDIRTTALQRPSMGEACKRKQGEHPRVHHVGRCHHCTPRLS